jgi:radical SAM protein with 4Fe4S-binding SPASM domain
MGEYVRQVKSLEKNITPRLAYLDIELTERCNNNCIHCCINLPANDREAQSHEMATEQIKTILNEAAILGCLKVRFTGGEPMLRPDFEELYLHARRLGIKVLVFTNACPITPGLADLLSRVPPKELIEITVYGMRRESYEAVSRAPGSFIQFRRGIQLLLEREVPFIVKYALLPANRDDFDDFEAWARTIPWMTEHPHYFVFFDLRNRRDNVEKNQLIKSLRMSSQDSLAVITRYPEEYRKNVIKFASKFMTGPPGDLLFQCGAGSGLSIDAYGQAQPCMGVHAPELTYSLIPETAIGIPRPSLAGALEHFKYLRELRAANPDYLRRCALCFLKGLCEQCPGKSWTENGTLDTPVEYLCEAAHAQARWLGWLGDNEWGWMVNKWKDRIKS